MKLQGQVVDPDEDELRGPKRLPQSYPFFLNSNGLVYTYAVCTVHVSRSGMWPAGPL
jgi:hypothetical protein